MATLIVKTNVARATDVLVNDVGLTVPALGGSLTFTDFDEIFRWQESNDLPVYLTDNAYGAGSSTLILNDGTSDIAQADATNFLNQVLLAAAGGAFGILKADSAGVLQAGAVRIANLGAPTAVNDATTKQYVDDAVTQGRVWREAILTASQLLNGGTGAVRQAIAFYLDGQPSNNDTFIITDGTTTETFTFKTVAGPAFQVLIGANANATMANLVSQIGTDSTLWDAVLETTLNSINDGSGTSTSGYVVVIYRTAQLVTTYTDRIYGVLTTPAFGQYVNYNGLLDYTSEVSAALPGADPAVKTFGFGRTFANLVNGETHTTLATDSYYTWDSDTDIWQATGGSGSFGTNIQPLGAAISAGTGSLGARDNHVHTHGDRGVDGAVAEHDAQQVDVTGTYTQLVGTPGTAEATFSAINANFGTSKYVGKLLDYSNKNTVTGVSQFLIYGEVVSSAVGTRMIRAGYITGASVQVDSVDAARSYNLTIFINGVSAATLNLPVSTLGVQTSALSVAFAAGDRLSVSMVRATGAGNSTFNNKVATIEIGNYT